MQHWGLTDPGCVREQNQDTYQIVPLSRNAVLCVVCDGMGGAKSGNVASSLAVEAFTQEVKRAWKSDMDIDQTDSVLQDAVKLANFTVYERSQQSEDFAGMGTTLVAVLIHAKTACVVNVGDSRAYHIHEDGICQVTVDHSLVQMMIDRGEMSKERAKNYPGKNLITRAIGTEPAVNCDIFHRKLERGDCVVLCTDGLSNLMDEQEILFEVTYGEVKEACCAHLLEIAKNRGAPDNVTSVLVCI